MHQLIYRGATDIHAVVHAHPPHATGFAVAGLALDKAILSEVVLTLGCVPLAGYGTPSTAELTKAIEPFLQYHDALLMANHGAVAYADTLEKAFNKLETLEHTARISLIARSLGNENSLPAEAVESSMRFANAAERCARSANGASPARPRRVWRNERRYRRSRTATIRSHSHALNSSNCSGVCSLAEGLTVYRAVTNEVAI